MFLRARDGGGDDTGRHRSDGDDLKEGDSLARAV